jgi:hypothetical protein
MDEEKSDKVFLLKVSNLFEVIKVLEYGVLAKIGGVPNSPTVYVPLVQGFCYADKESGTPSVLKNPAVTWFRVRQFKGHACDSGKIELYRTHRGLRVEGWGGLRVSRVSGDATAHAQELNAEYILKNNTLEKIREAGVPVLLELVQVAEQKRLEAEQKRLEAARLEQTRQDELKRLQEEAKVKDRLEVEMARLAKEKAEQEAKDKALHETSLLCQKIGVSLEEWQSMTDKQKGLSMHRARLAGRLK